MAVFGCRGESRAVEPPRRFGATRATLATVTKQAVPGVLLAGGAGTRFIGSTHKLLAPFRSRRVIDWSIDAIRTAGLEPWVVWGALADDPPPLDDDVVVLFNKRWAEGMSTTLHVATTRASELGLPAIVVGPADQPLIPAAAWRALADAQSPIAIATYDGKRANPVRLASEIWSELPDTGDFGARHLIRMRPELVLEVPCPGNPADIDTREDLERWNSSTNSP
jgi:molybdenum cofactor cytidylyltransferase